MHIIVGIITAIAGLVWALYRLQESGVNLNAFNPFTWARRRRWEKQLGIKPMHRLEDPVEAAALLVVGVAELPGGMTRDGKQEVLKLFVQEFGISERYASELYAASTHLLKETVNLADEVKLILAPTKAQYEERHKKSLLLMLQSAGRVEGEMGEKQKATIEAVVRELQINQKEMPEKW